MTDPTKSAVSAIEAKHKERKAHLASFREAQAEKRNALMQARAAQKEAEEKKSDAPAVKQTRAK